jgi:hypothetical protein
MLRTTKTVMPTKIRIELDPLPSSGSPIEEALIAGEVGAGGWSTVGVLEAIIEIESGVVVATKGGVGEAIEGVLSFTMVCAKLL